MNYSPLYRNFNAATPSNYCQTNRQLDTELIIQVGHFEKIWTVSRIKNVVVYNNTFCDNIMT